MYVLTLHNRQTIEQQFLSEAATKSSRPIGIKALRLTRAAVLN